MRPSALVVLLVILSVSSLRAEPTVMPLHDTPRQLPSIEFTDGEDRQHTLDDRRGKVVLLNIWATWCPPCRREMPTLDRLQGRLGGDRFDVVALSIDRGGFGPVRDFFAEIGVRHLGLYIDAGGDSVRKLGAFGLPTTLLIGPDGRELGRYVGPAEWDTPEMIGLFEAVVAAHRQQEKDE